MVKNDNSYKDCACYHTLREHNRESCDATKDIIVPPELKPLVNMFFSWGTGAKFKSFFTMLWEAQVRMTSPKQMISWKISKVPKGKRGGGQAGIFNPTIYVVIWTFGPMELKKKNCNMIF